MFFKTHEINLDPCNQCGNVPSDSCSGKPSFDLPQQNFEQNSPETVMYRSHNKPKVNQTQEIKKLEKRNKDGNMLDSMCIFRSICHSLCCITCRSLKRGYF